MAVEHGAQDIKRQLAELAKRRELIEAEANAAAARLEQAAVGMHDPLVDKEGFPRADIDIPAIRADRNKVIVLSNDHKELTREMEILLHRLHAIARGPGAAAASVSNPINHEHGVYADAKVAAPLTVPASSTMPFAEIDELNPNSPAERGGLKLLDKLVRFAHVTLQTPDRMQAVASALAAGEGKVIEAVVLREGRPVTLLLQPQKWEGRGLLGCHLRPLS